MTGFNVLVLFVLGCGYFSGNTDVILTLLRHTNCVNELDSHGRTPLYISCYCGRLEAARCLLSHGASVDQSVTSGVDKVRLALCVCVCVLYVCV